MAILFIIMLLIGIYILLQSCLKKYDIKRKINDGEIKIVDCKIYDCVGSEIKLEYTRNGNVHKFRDVMKKPEDIVGAEIKYYYEENMTEDLHRLDDFAQIDLELKFSAGLTAFSILGCFISLFFVK